MSLMKISPTTATRLRKTLNRTVRLTNYDDLPQSALYFPSRGKWVWEATTTHDLLVTLRRVDGTRLDSFDEDIVAGNTVYTTYAKSSAPADIAAAINRAYTHKCEEVAS